MKFPLSRKPIADSSDFRVVDASGEDIARVEGKHVAFSREASNIVLRSTRNLERLEKALDEAETELARFKADPKDLKSLDLTKLSRNSHILFTHIKFDDELSEVFTTTDDKGHRRGHNWLEFGECVITNEGRTCFIGSRMRDGITDFEHDSCYAVHIDLVGLRYLFTSSHVSHFEAHLTTKHEDIRIHEPDYEPEKTKGAWRCKEKSCEDKHLMLPDGGFTPPIYKFARVVAGRRISITMGPRWDVIEKREESDE